MKSTLFCLLLVAVCANGFTPGLRVRFAITLKITKTSFIDIPRYQSEVVKNGWVVKTRYNGARFSKYLSLYCPKDDNHFCGLYDNAGYIAGVQIALGETEWTNSPYTPESMGMKYWSTTENGVAKNFWVLEQFFVSESKLALSVSARNALHPNGEVAYDTNVWVSSTDGGLLQVPNDVTALTKKTAFTRQSCIPGMGRHYYYDMSEKTSCAKPLMPWFAMIHGKTLVGVGMKLYGKLPSTVVDKWFETAVRWQNKIIVPNAPECHYDFIDNNGYITMHIYYINEPWTLGCLNDE